MKSEFSPSTSAPKMANRQFDFSGYRLQKTLNSLSAVSSLAQTLTISNPPHNGSSPPIPFPSPLCHLSGGCLFPHIPCPPLWVSFWRKMLPACYWHFSHTRKVLWLPSYYGLNCIHQPLKKLMCWSCSLQDLIMWPYLGIGSLQT